MPKNAPLPVSHAWASRTAAVRKLSRMDAPPNSNKLSFSMRKPQISEVHSRLNTPVFHFYVEFLSFNLIYNHMPVIVGCSDLIKAGKENTSATPGIWGLWQWGHALFWFAPFSIVFHFHVAIIMATHEAQQPGLVLQPPCGTSLSAEWIAVRPLSALRFTMGRDFI